MSKSEDDRAKRLAQALRENLKRRKAQARGENGAPADPAVGDGDRDRDGDEDSG